MSKPKRQNNGIKVLSLWVSMLYNQEVMSKKRLYRKGTFADGCYILNHQVLEHMLKIRTLFT